MTHINLDTLDAAVRDFLITATTGQAGAVLEREGKPVAWLVPATGPEPAADAVWTEEKNHRRCDLIDRKYAGGISPAETVELAQLQEEMLRHRRRVAPLPLEEARRLHQELLQLAQAKSSAS